MTKRHLFYYRGKIVNSNRALFEYLYYYSANKILLSNAVWNKYSRKSETDL